MRRKVRVWIRCDSERPNFLRQRIPTFIQLMLRHRPMFIHISIPLPLWGLMLRLSMVLVLTCNNLG